MQLERKFIDCFAPASRLRGRSFVLAKRQFSDDLYQLFDFILHARSTDGIERSFVVISAFVSMSIMEVLGLMWAAEA
jgi:hypothetical protein